MSLIIIGQSRCSICQQVINEAEKYYQFPAFVDNSSDPMNKYNDANCHLKCLNNEEQGYQATRLAEKFVEGLKPENRRCFIKGTIISNADSDLYFGLLSSDKNNRAWVYNFTHFDRGNLIFWPNLKNLLDALQALTQNDKMGIKEDKLNLTSLINELKVFLE